MRSWQEGSHSNADLASLNSYSLSSSTSLDYNIIFASILFLSKLYVLSFFLPYLLFIVDLQKTIWFQRVGIHDDKVMTAGDRHEEQLKVRILNHEQQTEGGNSKWHESFETSKPTSSNILPARSHFLTFHKQPPTADQVLKCPRFMGVA